MATRKRANLSGRANGQAVIGSIVLHLTATTAREPQKDCRSSRSRKMMTAESQDDVSELETRRKQKLKAANRRLRTKVCRLAKNTSRQRKLWMTKEEAVTAISQFVSVILCLPNKAFCVDLTSGKKEALPGDGEWVKWLKKPNSNGGRCNLQGVLKIIPSKWVKSVSVHMTFENPWKYSFHLGDSSKNRGWGSYADGSHTNAETFGYGANLNAYRNKWHSSTKIFSKLGGIYSTMLINIAHHKMYATNYRGYHVKLSDSGLFSYTTDNIYLGVNRVIDNYNGSPYNGRDGSGLCSVCIYFQLSDKLYIP
ncbi:hypothetical protein LSAT2_016079 [Lamellibrachia satsuma]|nr:hypothetical protein LSAT2_016079 [Lamellibrachia satsuma]